VRYGVLAWFCTLSMITYIDRVCIMQVQDDMQSDLGLTKDQFAYAFSAFALAYALFEVPTGWLGDRIGPRKVLSRIVVCWLGFTALTGMATSWLTLVVVRFLFGAGEAGAYPNIARATKNWIPFRERGRAQGLIWTFGRWGGAVAPVLIIALTYPFVYLEDLAGWHVAGWRGAFFMLGLLGLAWVIGFRLFFRDVPREHPGVNEAELALIEGPAYEQRNSVEPMDADRQARASPPETGIVAAAGPLAPAVTESITATAPAAPAVVSATAVERPSLAVPAPMSWASILTSPTLWCLSFMYFCSNSGWSFFITYVTPYMKNDLQLSGWQLHLASGAPLFFGGIGCMLGGFVTDRQVRVWGRRWGRTLQGLIAYALGGTFFLVAVWLTATHGALAFAALCLASFLKDLGMAASWSTTIDIGHRYSGTVAGVMNTVGNMGTVVSPLIVSRLVNIAGATGATSWSISLYYYAAMFFVASAAWAFIEPRRVIVYTPEDRKRLELEGVLQ
jgi:MFS family permease